MARILFFDDRGYLYFDKKEELIYMRNGIVEAVNKKLCLGFPDDTELILYSLGDHNIAYKRSSVDGSIVNNNWIEGIEDLFEDNDLVICDYNWNTAGENYYNARDTIVSAVLNSGKNIYFILYSAVLAKAADEYYMRIRKQNRPASIHLAKEVATFNEELESMHYTLTRKMKKLFGE